MRYHQQYVVGHYVANTKCITKNLNIKKTPDNEINARIMDECIKIRDDTMNCDTMSQCDVNNRVMYLTTM